MNEQADESPQMPSSQDLFEKMLEEQLKKEEERLKLQPASQGKPKVPYKPPRAKNKNPSQQKKEQVDVQEATIHRTPESKASNSSSEQQETATEQKSLHSSGSKTPRPAENIVAEPVPKKRKISQENPLPVSTSVMEEQSSGLSSNELFERQLEEQLKKHNEEANMQETTATGELSQRLFDKNWKTRKEAYDELSKLFSSAQSDTDPCFETHAPLIHKLVQDKHANSLEAALGAVLHFVTGYKYAARCVAEVVTNQSTNFEQNY